MNAADATYLTIAEGRAHGRAIEPSGLYALALTSVLPACYGDSLEYRRTTKSGIHGPEAGDRSAVMSITSDYMCCGAFRGAGLDARVKGCVRRREAVPAAVL